MNESPTHSVFIADDDEDDRLLLQYAFTQHCPECHLRFAEDGLVLLADLDQDSSLPCLIILDLNMPRLNGLEALRVLRHSVLYQQTPIVILTTSSDEADKKLAYELGANEFLVKPLSLDSLGKMVQHLRKVWQLDECI